MLYTIFITPSNDGSQIKNEAKQKKHKLQPKNQLQHFIFIPRHCYQLELMMVDWVTEAAPEPHVVAPYLNGVGTRNASPCVGLNAWWQVAPSEARGEKVKPNNWKSECSKVWGWVSMQLGLNTCQLGQAHLQPVPSPRSWVEAVNLTPLEPNTHVRSKTFSWAHNIGDGVISMDAAKIQAIVDWPAPQKVTELRSLYDLANYGWQFIKGHPKTCWLIN